MLLVLDTLLFGRLLLCLECLVSLCFVWRVVVNVVCFVVSVVDDLFVCLW